MSATDAAPVVVGLDGSADARNAVDYAAWEAQRRGLPLRLVYGFQPVAVYGPSMVGDPVSWPLQQIQARLTETAEAVRRRYPRLPVDFAVLTGSPSIVLIDESHRASLMVLGSRGLGGFSGLLLGSVGSQVAAHAHCPVIVLRPPLGEALQPLPDTGRVVVGVDGSPVAEAACAFAFEEAAGRGVPLVAVHVWRVPPGHHQEVRTDQPVDPAERAHAEAERTLAGALVGWPEKYPQVLVARHAVPGDSPAKALMDEAAGAGLIVVGSRGRGGFAGLRLGSVGHALVTHAHVPVAVVHGDRNA